MAFLHFLLIYDHRLEQLISAEEFSDGEAAAAAYAAAERAYKEESNLEIVLVGADSLDTIRKTHSNYFERGSGAPFALGAGWFGAARFG